MRDAADYPAPGELEDGPCRHEDHNITRSSEAAFMFRTKVQPRWTWDGVLYGNCVRCGSTLGIALPKTNEGVTT
jgi:hypothetical protein